MMIRILSIGLAAIACAGIVRADDPPAKKKAEAMGALVGRVVDLKGHPVDGAEVWGTIVVDRVAATRTGRDGRFRLGPIAAEKAVALWFEAPGRSRQRRERLHVFAGRDRNLGDLTALPGTRFRGRLVDAKGRTIAGAKLAVEVRRFLAAQTTTSNETRWDLDAGADGRFETPPLPPGMVDLMFDAPAKVRTLLTRWAEPGVEAFDLGDVALVEEVPIRGLVLDQDGRPAPGVRVIVDYDHEGAVSTDASGRFLVHGAGKDAKTLMLRSNDYFAPKRVLEIGPDHDHIRITVAKAHRIQGTVVDAESDKPVEIDTMRLCRVVRERDGSYVLVG